MLFQYMNCCFCYERVLSPLEKLSITICKSRARSPPFHTTPMITAIIASPIAIAISSKVQVRAHKNSALRPGLALRTDGALSIRFQAGLFGSDRSGVDGRAPMCSSSGGQQRHVEPVPGVPWAGGRKYVTSKLMTNFPLVPYV
jgi:hypothetical protein